MTEEKKPRPMTPKKFAVAKLSGRSTSEGYLEAQRAFLLNYDFALPILEAYDDKLLLPTVALQALQSAMLTFHMASEMKTEEAKMAKRAAGITVRKKKNADGTTTEVDVPDAEYTITLFCKVAHKDGSFHLQVGTVEKRMVREVEKNGEKKPEYYTESKPAVWSAHTYGEASKLADRRLVQREDSVYALVENNQGKKITTRIDRADAIARVFPRVKGPASRTRGKSTSRLGFGAHAKPSQRSFRSY